MVCLLKDLVFTGVVPDGPCRDLVGENRPERSSFKQLFVSTKQTRFRMRGNLLLLNCIKLQGTQEFDILETCSKITFPWNKLGAFFSSLFFLLSHYDVYMYIWDIEVYLEQNKMSATDFSTGQIDLDKLILYCHHLRISVILFTLPLIAPTDLQTRKN